jgi:hypothetical protein
MVTRKSAKGVKSSRKTKPSGGRSTKTKKGGASKTESRSKTKSKTRSKPNWKKIVGVAGTGIATAALLYKMYKGAKESGRLDKLKNIFSAIAKPPVPEQQQQYYPPTSPSGMVQMESMSDLSGGTPYYSAQSIIPPPMYRSPGNRSPML